MIFILSSLDEGQLVIREKYKLCCLINTLDSDEILIQLEKSNSLVTPRDDLPD
jgi:hypothetical protein